MCASPHLHIFCSVWHIENVGQEYVAVEAEALEEQQLQESEVAEEDREFETDLANPDLQQGKHQNHFHPESYIHWVYAITYVLLPVHLS